MGNPRNSSWRDFTIDTDGKMVNAKKRKKPQQYESNLQIGCVQWFKLQYPHLHRNIFAIPNGGSRNVLEARKMRAEGTLSGVPDLFLSVPVNKYHGLYIEMKYGENTLTSNQDKFINNIVRFDYAVWVCYTLDDFMEIINNYLKDFKNPTSSDS